MAATGGGRESTSVAKTDAVVIVFRHGARSLSMNALKGLAELERVDVDLETDDLGPILGQWKLGELDKMSTVGEAQSRALGRWFREGFLRRRCSGLGDAPISWFSSPSKRAEHSGKEFMAAATPIFPSSPLDLPESIHSTPRAAFQPWMASDRYLHALRAWKESDSLEEEGKHHEKFLRRVVGGVIGDSASLGKMLYATTYLHELLACEVAWPSTAALLRRKREGGDESTILAPAKDAANRAIAPDDQEHVSVLARWVWDQRFFVFRESSALGCDALSLIATQLSEGGASAISAHDYTLLSILRALRISAYPEEGVLEFSSFLLFERRVTSNVDGEPCHQVRVSLCHQPFPEQGFPDRLLLSSLHSIVDDLPLEALQATAERGRMVEEDGSGGGGEGV